MTKREYIAVAAILNTHGKASTVSQSSANERVEGIAHDLADLFQKDNPRFDRDRFSIAAGVPSVRK